MSYMAWPLIILCWHKSKTEKSVFNKSLIGFIAFFLFFTSAVQTYMTLWHEKLTGSQNDLNAIINEIAHFDFLLNPNFNFLSVLSILICFYCLILPYKDSLTYKFFKSITLLIFLSVFFVLICSIFQATSNFIAPNSIRLYPPIIALPFSLLIWWIYETKKVNIQKSNKVFLLSCILFVLIFVLFRFNTDYKFHRYRIKMSEQVFKSKGIVQWKSFANQFTDTKFNINCWIGIVGRFIKCLCCILNLTL